MSVAGLGAWCDFVTEDEYRQRLIRDGWPADEVENLVEDFTDERTTGPTNQQPTNDDRPTEACSQVQPSREEGA